MRHIAVVGCGQWGTNLVRNFAELGASQAGESGGRIAHGQPPL